MESPKHSSGSSTAMAAAKQRQQQSSGSNTGSWKTFGAGGIKWKPQQIAVALLIHPKSPMKRLLVDHNTGSGKTLVMLAIMENYNTMIL